MTNKTKPVHILINEWVPSLNKGELAILMGIKKTFSVIDPVRLSILSFYPDLDVLRYPSGTHVIDAGDSFFLGDNFPEKSLIIRIVLSAFVGIQHILFMFLYLLLGRDSLRIMKKKIWEEMVNSDVIIIGHDQVDVGLGFFLLLHPIYTVFTNKVLRKKLVIYGNGYSQSKISDFLLPFVLLNVDLITTREMFTYNHFSNITTGKVPIFLTGDPAILLEPCDKHRVDEILQDEQITFNDGPVIGLVLSYWVISSSTDKKVDKETVYGLRIQMFKELIDHLIEKFNTTIIFLPHSIEQYQNLDDRKVANDIYILVENKSQLFKIDEEYSVQELKGLMGELDILISTRVHALIGAATMAVPFICLKYGDDKRGLGILGGEFKQRDWVLDIDLIQFDEFLHKTLELLEKQDVIRKELQSITRILEKKAMFNGELFNLMLSGDTSKLEDLMKQNHSKYNEE